MLTDWKKQKETPNLSCKASESTPLEAYLEGDDVNFDLEDYNIAILNRLQQINYDQKDS